MSIPGSASPLFFQTAAGEAAAFQIDRSLRFNSGDSAYLNRTPSSAGNRRTFTWSGWVKRTVLGADKFIFSAGGDASNFHYLRFKSNDTLEATEKKGDAVQSSLITTAVYRDPSAWMHIVYVYDSTQSTAADRLSLYVNGAEVTSFGTSTYPSQNHDTFINNNIAHYINTWSASNGHADAYLTEIQLLDGTAVSDASDFGEYDSNNVWQPKDTSSLTFGTNGFRLKFDDNSSNSALGNDSSGNDNDWTVNNVSVTAGAANDSLLDTPTNYEAASGENGGNYCTWNPLDMETGVITLSEGNLKTVTTSSTGDNVRGTFGFSSGKWYWECTITDFSGGFDIGFATPEWDLTAGDVGSVANSWSVSDSGTSKNQGSNTGSATSAFNSTGTVVGIAFDADAGSVKYFIDGTDEGVIFSGLDTSYTYMPAIYLRVGNTGGIWNFGQRGSYTYAPPSGYKGLCTTNLAEPTIADGSTAMDAITYTGNGSSKTISGVGFTSDLIWTKCRNQARSHYLVDTVRGISKYLVAEQSSQEGTNTTNRILSLTSDGWTLGTNNAFNGNNDTYVAWAWDGGTSTVSNTDGGRTTNVRANATVGFSIVTFNDGNSANTYGHGLNAAPEFIIVKTRDTSANWFVYHSALGATKYIQLNKTGGANSSANHFNNTAPTSSVFSLGSDISFDADQVAFCWTPVEGYSAIGSYTGNGNADGPFIFTGFRPAFILLKRTDTTGFNWILSDTTRDPNNEAENLLRPNLSDAEVSQFLDQDILSNGFKHRGTDGASNASGGTYIYMAFAEHPFKTARAR